MRYRLQDFVNSLSDGLGVRLLRGVLWFVLVAGVLSLYYASQYRGFTASEPMEQCHLARNLAQTGRFETKVVRPLDAWALSRGSAMESLADGVPDIRTPPAYAWVLSRFMPRAPDAPVAKIIRRQAARTERWTVPLLGGLLTVATAFIILWLGCRLFSERVGHVALVAYVVSSSVLGSAFSGTARPLATFLVTAVFALCIAAAPAVAELRVRVVSWAGIMVAGLLCAVAILCNYSMALMLIPVILLLGASCGAFRWGATTLVWVLALGLSAPWFARNVGLTGNPFGTATFAALYDTLLYPGESVDRALAPLVHGSYLVPAVRMKMMGGLASVVDDGLRLIGAGLLGSCFWVSLFYRFDEERVEVLKWSTALGLILVAGVCAFDFRMVAYLDVLLPLVVLVGVGFLAVLMERLLFVDESLRSVLLWCLVGLAALPSLLQIFGVRADAAYPPYHPPTAHYVASVMEQDECVVTDIPWATAWYGDHRSVLLPTRVRDLADLKALQLNVGGLYLTQKLSDAPYMSGLAAHYARDRSWLPLLNQQIPTDLPFVHGLMLPAGARDQLFLTDRVRWEALSDLPESDAPHDPTEVPVPEASTSGK